MSTAPRKARRVTRPDASTIVSLLVSAGASILLLVIAIGFRGSQAGLVIIGAILATGLGLAIMLAPQLGGYVLAVTIFTNVSTVFTERGYPGLNKPIVGLVFVSVVASRLLRRQTLFRFERTEKWMVLYGAALMLSIVVATDRALAVDLLLDFAKDFVIFLCIISTLETKESWKRAAWLILLSASLLGAVSMIQVVTGQFANDFLGFGHVEAGVEGYDLFRGRISGPLADPNFYGQILVAVLPLAIYRLLRGQRFLPRLAGAGAAILILFAAMNTYSRGAFVALVLQFGLIIVEQRLKFRLLLGTLAVGAVGFLLMPQGYVERLDTFSLITSDSGSALAGEESFRGRASEAISGITMFIEHPLLGVGAGNYVVNYLDYASQIGLEQRLEPRQAHSLYIEAAAETGLLGLIAFLGILASTHLDLWRARKYLQQAGANSSWIAWIAAVQIGLLSYMTTSVLLHNDYIRYFWLLLALAVAAARLSYPGERPDVIS